MKKIGILGDTHSCWDDRFADHFMGCDEIWHTGDIGDIDIIRRLEEVAPVRWVFGNIDHGEVRRKGNEAEIFEIENIRVFLTHIGGYPGKWSRGIKNLLKEEKIRLMVCGHSHILKVIYDKELDLLHINPGAAGYQGWHSVRTLITIELDKDNFYNCNIIELGRPLH